MRPLFLSLVLLGCASSQPDRQSQEPLHGHRIEDPPPPHREVEGPIVVAPPPSPEAPVSPDPAPPEAGRICMAQWSNCACGYTCAEGRDWREIVSRPDCANVCPDRVQQTTASPQCGFVQGRCRAL